MRASVLWPVAAAGLAAAARERMAAFANDLIPRFWMDPAIPLLGRQEDCSYDTHHYCEYLLFHLPAPLRSDPRHCFASLATRAATLLRCAAWVYALHCPSFVLAAQPHKAPPLLNTSARGKVSNSRRVHQATTLGMVMSAVPTTPTATSTRAMTPSAVPSAPTAPQTRYATASPTTAPNLRPSPARSRPRTAAVPAHAPRPAYSSAPRLMAVTAASTAPSATGGTARPS
jgi:hypothetical protein